MNDIFSLPRFANLFIKHTAEHYKVYLMSAAVLMGVLILGLGCVTYMQDAPIETSMQITAFVFILFLAGTIFTSNIFEDMGDKKRAVASLTLPASHLEKYLVAWIYSYLIFQLVYTGGFYLVMMLFLNLKQVQGQHVELLNIFAPDLSILLYIFAFMHAIALCGAIFFDKLHFIKTGFIFFVMLVFFLVINKQLMEVLIGRDILKAIPFLRVLFMEDKTLRYVDGNSTSLVTCTLTVLALILWTAAYYRLKEKEV